MLFISLLTAVGWDDNLFGYGLLTTKLLLIMAICQVCGIISHQKPMLNDREQLLCLVERNFENGAFLVRSFWIRAWKYYICGDSLLFCWITQWKYVLLTAKLSFCYFRKYTILFWNFNIVKCLKMFDNNPVVFFIINWTIKTKKLNFSKNIFQGLLEK